LVVGPIAVALRTANPPSREKFATLTYRVNFRVIESKLHFVELAPMVKGILRICLRYFWTGTAVWALGVCFLPATILAQNQPSIPGSRIAQEEDIREAAFLFLFDISTGPFPDYSFYCLSVNSGGLNSGDDPSETLLKQLSRMHQTIHKASNCEILKKPKDLFSAVRDKQSGKPAWMISLTSINWLSDKEVRVGGARYCGGLCLWSSTLQATFQDGKWKVRIAPGAFVLLSQGFSGVDWIQARANS